MSLWIASLAEMKSELGLAVSDTEDDARLTRLAESIQGAFSSNCRRRFDVATLAERHDGGKAAIWLRAAPVHEVVAVTIDGAEVDPERDLRGPSPTGGLYWRHTPVRWPGSIGSITVEYTGGLFDAEGAVHAGAVEAIPWAADDAAAIRRAFFLQFGFEWRNRLTLGAASVSQQGQSVSLAPAKMLPDVARILNDFRNMA